MSTDIIFLEDASLGERLRVRRLARRLRQGDVAYLATQWAAQQGWGIRIPSQSVSFLERDWGIKRHHKAAICAVLGVSE